MRRLLTTCPSCGGKMIVSELSCTDCETVVRGKYTGCTFCALSDENLRFLEIYVGVRGNLKEMERETGLGYWTIRGRLDEVIESLRLNVEQQPPDGSPDEKRRAILESVERGDLTIEAAERMLRELISRNTD
ncbi:MAG: DUF2089 domain-containing protein [Anaerolineae bacterium]|nr:DUF2089 domain-containing protein [Anaerolineae bacterium]